MDCRCNAQEFINHQLFKIDELVEASTKLVRTAGDPISAVIRFLHERPDHTSLPGYVIDKVLQETFGTKEQVPGLVHILSSHVKEIIRHSNVIDIIKEHHAVEKWGSHLIKQTEVIKFEIAKENNKLALKNIKGLLAVEHGIDIPVDKILVNPPKLEVTLRIGLLRPQRILDIV